MRTASSHKCETKKRRLRRTQTSHNESERFRILDPFDPRRRRCRCFFLVVVGVASHILPLTPEPTTNETLPTKTVSLEPLACIIMSTARMHVFCLNTAKSLTQILVLWLTVFLLSCHAEEVASKPTVAPWVSNLHSFAAGGRFNLIIAIQRFVVVVMVITEYGELIFLTVSFLAHRRRRCVQCLGGSSL